MAHLDNVSIGKRIKELRKHHNMTQENLAERLDISVKHCSYVERGTSGLSLERMLDICELFDVSLDYLVKGHNINNLDFPESIIEIFHSNDKHEISILKDYLNLYSKLRK